VKLQKIRSATVFRTAEETASQALIASCLATIESSEVLNRVRRIDPAATTQQGERYSSPFITA